MCTTNRYFLRRRNDWYKSGNLKWWLLISVSSPHLSCPRNSTFLIWTKLYLWLTTNEWLCNSLEPCMTKYNITFNTFKKIPCIKTAYIVGRSKKNAKNFFFVVSVRWVLYIVISRSSWRHLFLRIQWHCFYAETMHCYILIMRKVTVCY